MRVAEAIAAELAGAGVRRIYGIPGGGSNMLLIDAATAAGIEFVLLHHEPAAMFAAAAEAEITGRPAVCLATLGPGVANSVNGLAHCLLDRVPLLLITDSPGANDYLHQRLAHETVVAGVVKRSETLTPQNVVGAVRAAVHDAARTPRGPVHLDLAADVARAQADTADPPAESAPADPAANEDAVREAAALLARSRRPLVLAGLGAATPGATAALRALVERLGAPVLTTYKGKGVLPERHPLAAGLVTNGAVEATVFDAADLVLTVGLDEVELMPGPWRWTHPTLTVGAGPGAGAHVQSTVDLGRDVAGALASVTDLLPAGWRSDWDAAALPSARPAAEAVTRRNGGGLAPASVVAAARRLAPHGAIATVDAGSHMFAATLFWTADEPRRFLISNGLSTMGYALPAAIGAALCDGGPVVCFTGDGGLAMAVGELETAARLRVPVTIVVFNDSTLNLIKIKQEKRGETTHGLDFGAIDWVAVANGMGVSAERVEEEQELEQALVRAVAAREPRLLDVAIDPASYPAMLDVIRG
jgi:acetolactate synthase-1/2/3 large subunit